MKKKILVVDDEEDIRLTLERYFRMDGKYQIAVAMGGIEALKIIETEKIDLVLLDERMPEMSGMDLLVEVKQVKPGMPVLLMSGDRDAELLATFSQTGSAGFIPKPFDLAKLKSRIESIL